MEVCSPKEKKTPNLGNTVEGGDKTIYYLTYQRLEKMTSK